MPRHRLTVADEAPEACMHKSRFTNTRRVVALIALGLGCGLVAPAFARSHVSVNVGVGLPGLSIGYSDYHRYGHGYRHGYVYGGPVYYPGPVYYRPAPRVVYYDAPVVVERPVYVRHEPRVIYRDGYRDHGYIRYDDED